MESGAWEMSHWSLCLRNNHAYLQSCSRCELVLKTFCIELKGFTLLYKKAFCYPYSFSVESQQACRVRRRWKPGWRCIPLAKVMLPLYPIPQPTSVTPTPRTTAESLFLLFNINERPDGAVKSAKEGVVSCMHRTTCISCCFEHFHSWWLWDNLMWIRFDQKYACLQEWMRDTKLTKVEWSWSHWLAVSRCFALSEPDTSYARRIFINVDFVGCLNPAGYIALFFVFDPIMTSRWLSVHRHSAPPKQAKGDK